MPDEDHGVLYPRYCFHLSPTVNKWAFLRVKDVQGLKQYDRFDRENLFFYRNLPIRWVRVTGVVVAIDEFSGRRIYIIDDSSGQCIEAVTKVNVVSTYSTTISSAKGAKAMTEGPTTEPPKPAEKVIAVGDVVDAKGSLSIFRDERQINIEKIVTVKGTAQELQLWEKRARFRRNVLTKPWHVNRHELQRCRKEAEILEKEQERKNKRAREKADRDARRMRPNKSPVQHRDNHKKTKPDEIANNVKALIREGAANGKYSALGL